MATPEPNAWWETLAEGWERVADRLEAKTQGNASPISTKDARAGAVATTARALAAGLRAAAGRADTHIGHG